MHRTKARLRLASATTLLTGILLLVPVIAYAQQGSDDSTSTKSSLAEPEANDSAMTHDKGDEKIAGKAREALQTKAQALVSEKRATVKQHTAEQKQKSCTARAANINKRADNYAAHAQKHLDVFNKISARVQAFQTKKHLDVENYDQLLATVAAKQTTAQQAVDVLKTLDVDIDCTQGDPATAVAALKTATGNARTALQDYRKSIKDLTVALKSASTAQSSDDSTASGGDTSENTGGTQ